MARAKNELAPRMAAANAATDSGSVYSQATRNRTRAVIDRAMEMLTGDKPRKDSEGRDVYQVLADQILADPRGSFAELEKLLPKAPEQAGGGFNIGALYVQAVQAAQPRRLDVVDVTAEPEQPEEW